MNKISSQPYLKNYAIISYENALQRIKWKQKSYNFGKKYIIINKANKLVSHGTTSEPATQVSGKNHKK